VEELAGRVDGIRKGCIVAFGLKDAGSGTEKLIVVAESRENDPSRRSSMAVAVTNEVLQGLGIPPDRVELIPPGSIPKTSSGKLRREETRGLFIAGTLTSKKAPAWLQIARLGTSGTLKNIFQVTASALRRGSEMLYGIYFGVIFAIWIVPACAGVLFFRDHSAAGRYTSAVLRILFFLSGTSVRVIGKEFMNTPGAKIYASNHTSYFDVLPLMMGLGVPYRFVAKSEVHNMPFIGTFLRKMGHLSFVRTDTNSRREAIQQIESAVRDGDSVFCFSGRYLRSRRRRPAVSARRIQRGPSLREFPSFPFRWLARVVFLRDGTLFPRPTSVTITLSPPLWPKIFRKRDLRLARSCSPARRCT